MLVIYWRSGIWKKNQGCFNLSQFMVTGIGANPLKIPYCTLTLSLRVKSIFRAVPHVTAKSSPNTPETQEITTTQVSWAEWTILLHFSTFWGQFKISHTILYMMFPIAWATCDIYCIFLLQSQVIREVHHVMFITANFLCCVFLAGSRGGHSFVGQNFTTLKWCDKCGKCLWGLRRQGVQCSG